MNKIAAVVAGLCLANASVALAAKGPPHTTQGTRDDEIMMAKVTFSDIDASLAWYQKNLGLVVANPKLRELLAKGPVPRSGRGGTFREVPLNFTGLMSEAHFVLMQEKEFRPDPAAAQRTWIGIKVKNLEEVRDRMKANGVTFGEIRQSTVRFRIAFVDDPDGYRIELLEADKGKPSPR